jgi:hypothetical protein
VNLTDDEKTLHKIIHSLLKAYGEVMKDPEDMTKMADYGEIYMNVFERITLKSEAGEKKGREDELSK